MKPRYEVADIIRVHGQGFQQQYRLPAQVFKTLNAIEQCRTAALGGHVERCGDCGHEHISYNSCRNRHCPKCQVTNREKWIKAREAELLPVPYYHLVFTLPATLNVLLPSHAKVIYSALFKAAWTTVQAFAGDPKYLGAKTGMVAILHTWGQQLWLHPHLHCIVPGGGVTPAGKWKAAKHGNKYLFPKRAMITVFRAKLMAEVRRHIAIPQPVARQCFAKPWVVYAKRPFASPKTVVEYLGRYTHKIAISNHRLTGVNDKTVSFTYKDYRQAGQKKTATVSGVEFLRRFSQHILSHGFVRIRHYGFLASRNKPKELNLAKAHFDQPEWEKQQLTWQDVAEQIIGQHPGTCPKCKKQALKIVAIVPPLRGPPAKPKPKNNDDK